MKQRTDEIIKQYKQEIEKREQRIIREIIQKQGIIFAKSRN